MLEKQPEIITEIWLARYQKNGKFCRVFRWRKMRFGLDLNPWKSAYPDQRKAGP